MPSSRIGPAGWLVAAIGCAIWPAAHVAEQSRAAPRQLVIVTLDTAAAPRTLPAHTSLFTGLAPKEHHVRGNADPALSPAQVTLAQVLRSCGWQTGAFVGSAVLAATRGLASGFDVYDDGRLAEAPLPASRPASVVIDRALEWMNGAGDRPFFLWVNLSDAQAEAPLARLIRALERRRTRDAVVIVASDQRKLPDELLVPVSIRAPRVTAQRVDGVVSVIDLGSTALDLLQMPSSLGDGRSFAPAMREHRSIATTRR